MGWSDIIGHEREKQFLQKLLTARRRPHAFLFTGPPGVGKRLLADTFAAALLCGAPGAPCGQCLSCRQFRQGSHPDYFLLQPELKKDSRTRKDSIGINQVRELCEDAAFAPKQSPARVLVLDGAQLMTAEAANSLLKLLEEPPARWLFLLLSDSADTLLPTVVSRAARLRVSPVSARDAADHLRSAGVPDIAAALSCGAFGQAVRYGAAQVLRRQALLFLQAALRDDYTVIARCLEDIDTRDKEQQKEDSLLLCEFIAFFLRDAWQIACGAADIWNTDSAQELARLFPGQRARDFKKLLRHAEQAWGALKRAANPRLVMEGLYLDIAAAGRP